VDLSLFSEISDANRNEDLTVSSNLTVLFLPMLLVMFSLSHSCHTSCVRKDNITLPKVQLRNCVHRLRLFVADIYIILIFNAILVVIAKIYWNMDLLGTFVWMVEASSHLNVSNMFQTFLLEEPSSVTLLPSDLTPKKPTDTTGAISSTNCIGADEIDSSKFNSVEAEITVNFLRNVKTEVLNSVNAAPQRRIELMDRIIEYIVSDLQTYTLPEERDQFAHLISMKNRMLFLCIFIWIIGVSVVLFFTSDTRSPYRGPTPT